MVLRSRASSRRSCTCSRWVSGSGSSSIARPTSPTDLLPRVRRSGPHGGHRDAARHVRVELAGALRDQVGSPVPRDARHAASLRRHPLGHQTFVAGRILMTATVYLVVITAFGAVSSPLGSSRSRLTLLVGLSVLLPIAAWAAHTGDRGVVRRDLSLRDPPDVPLLGDVLPDLDPSGAARGDRVPDASLARRDPLPRPDSRRRGALERAAHVGYLLAAAPWVSRSHA